MKIPAKGISSMRDANRRHGRPGVAFWLLVGLLAVTFLTGGSSRANIPMLAVLRPIATIAAFYGLATLPSDRWRAYRAPFALAGAILALTIFHLIPLPPSLWRLLPGHELPFRIDQILGGPAPWRPLSLEPSTTLNALFSLSVPIAVFSLAVQLHRFERIWLFFVVLALGGASAIVGALQAAGMPLNLYDAIQADAIEAPGLLANKNHQAALLAAMLPMLAAATRLAPEIGLSRKFFGALAIIGTLVIVPLLIVTGSRSGLALGLISIAITLFYGLLPVDRLHRLNAMRVSSIKVLLAMLLIAVSATVTVLAQRDVAFSRLATAGDDLRPKLWASIAPILPIYQPFGSGIGSYVEVYRSHEPVGLLRTTNSNHAHNEYLEIFMTAGVPGAALLCWAGVLILVAFWRNRQGDDADRILARAGVAVMLIFAGASVTDYPVRAPLIAAVFAVAAMWCTNPRNAAPSAQEPSVL